MRGRIAHLSTLAKRFAAVLRRCDVESFLGIGRVYPEIAPIEKRIDMHIDLLKREEFRELECVSDVSKFSVCHYYSSYYHSNIVAGYWHNSSILAKHTSPGLTSIWASASWIWHSLLITTWTCSQLQLA